MADDLFSLERDLREVGAEANKRIAQATEHTAYEIRNDWRQGAEHTGLEGYAASIQYEMEYGGDSIGAVIRPGLGGQGALSLVEDAVGDVRSAPQHAGRDAARANEDDYVRGIEIAVTGAVEDKVGR